MENGQESGRPYAVWERSTRRSAWGFALVSAAGIALLAVALRPPEAPWWTKVPFPAATAWVVYRAMTRRIRRRRACLAWPFAPE